MRNGKKVWYCKRISADNADVVEFAQPVEFTLKPHFLTVQPSNGYSEVVEFGKDVGKTWTAIGQPYKYWFDLVHEDDRFYVDGAKPTLEYDDNGELIEPDDGWGMDANARIYSVRPQNEVVKFILKKIE